MEMELRGKNSSAEIDSSVKASRELLEGGTDLLMLDFVERAHPVLES